MLRREALDWVIIGVFALFVTWLMFATFSATSDSLRMGNLVWSDFGPHTAVMQSFASGRNFPTEYPHFGGEPIKYHFLFFFQAGNLSFLGLNPGWSLNLLSILSMVSMLVLVMNLGELLFNSKAVARIGAALFFFHGSLAYVGFFRSHPTIGEGIRAAFNRQEFLPTGFPYRGETWGVWTLLNFINQRHITSAIGALLLVLIYLLMNHKQPVNSQPVENQSDAEPSDSNEEEPTDEETEKSSADQWRDLGVNAKAFVTDNRGYLFCGLLLGLLPLWNGAVFACAFAVLLSMLILFPFRQQLLAVGFMTAIVAIPQLIYLRSGNLRPRGYSFFHWGYTIDNPTVAKVVEYLAYTFGFKWIAIGLALAVLSSLQRRFFIAITSLIALAFFFQLSEETLANHKFLNVWLITANLYAGFGIWWLVKNALLKKNIVSGIAVIVLVLGIVIGGVIDLFPIRNGYWVEVKYKNDPLIDWILTETKPDDLFLTDRYVSHPILTAGRRLFFGWPYYAWGAGYKTEERGQVYRSMLEAKNPAELSQLLAENNIAYVAFDDALRQSNFVHPNEAAYRNSFEKAFEDRENRFGNLVIYRVAAKAEQPEEDVSRPGDASITVSMFIGGKGRGFGQFDRPRGIAIDRSGNILVADTYNHRIQKFSSKGIYMESIGSFGQEGGQLNEPNGIAIDKEGNLYITDSLNHRIQQLDEEGNYLSDWRGPPPNLYGPRDIAIGQNNTFYIVDQGRARIVKCDSDWKLLGQWGTHGAEDGNFDDPTSVAVDIKTNRVFVADPRNGRIQVFDGNGKFLSKWEIPEWQINIHQYPFIRIDERSQLLYASSTATDEVLVFDLNGKKVRSLTPEKEKLEGPSGIAIARDKLFVVNTHGSRVSVIDLKRTR